MAEQSFSMLCNEILTKYPQIINSATQIANDKKSISTELANTKQAINADLSSAYNKISTELDNTKQVINTSAKKISDNMSAIINLNSQTNEATANAKAYMSAANEYMKATQKLEAQAKDDVLASNAAKIKAMEYATKAQTDLSEVIKINSAFKLSASNSINELNKKTTQSLGDINTKGALINSALEAKSDYEMGRMEFKRRQVDEKIKQANAVIAGLESGTLSSEINNLITKNKWDRAVLECGIMDAIFSKAELLFINEECEEIKEATRKISVEVELDRLEIIRLKEEAKTAAQMSKDFAKSF